MDILPRLWVRNDKVVGYTMAGRVEDVCAVEIEMCAIADGVVDIFITVFRRMPRAFSLQSTAT